MVCPWRIRRERHLAQAAHRHSGGLSQDSGGCYDGGTLDKPSLIGQLAHGGQLCFLSLPCVQPPAASPGRGWVA